MSAPFAPTSLFQARAVHTRGDDWIEDGVHLRVRVSSLLGFPICPFAAWRIPVEAVGTEPRAFGGPDAASGFFDPDEPLTLLPSGGGLWSYLELEAEGFPVFLDAIAATSGRTLGRRSDEPHAVAGFDLAAVRVLGSGRVLAVRAAGRPDVDRGTVDSQADFTFGLPVVGSDWYAQPGAVDPRAAAKDRVLAGTARQTGPAEAPDGSFEGLGPDADAALVFDHLAPEHLDGWTDAAWNQGAEPPSDVRLAAQREPDDPVTAELPDGIGASVGFAPADALLTASEDPRIGRFAGLVTTEQVPDGSVRPAIWLVASQWSVRTRPGSALDALLDSADASELGFALEREFEPLRFVRDRWLEARETEAGRWRVVTLATLACAALEAPFDPPLVEPVAGASWWNPSSVGRWAQRIELPGEPVGIAAFARTAPDELRLNRIVNTGFGERALGLVPQYRRPTGSSPGGSALLDGNVDGEVGTGRWLVALADDVGRWGEAGEVEGTRPSRPLPGPPGIEATQTSAANLHVRVEVPGHDEQPTGAPAVREVALMVAGVPQPVQEAPPPTRPPTPLVWDVPIAGLGVGEVRDVVVETTLVTDEPPPHSAGTRAVTVRDPRVGPAPRTGPALIWTAAGDASGLAELGLQWPGAERTRYRVYLGDERVLAAALGLTVDPSKPRAERAAAIVAESARLADKGLFTLLTAEPVAPDADRDVRFRHRLPGALRNVQFARVVPVSEHGNVEGPFAGPKLVPIAVPLTESPPPPTLSVAPRADGVRLTVEARGIRSDVLDALAAADTGARPQVRLRRALGRVADAETMVAEPPVELEPPAEPGGAWTATLDVAEAALPALVRALWVAEVRYPPEPALEPGVNPNPREVTPLAGAAGDPRELNWSAPSLSVSTVRIPSQPPAAIDGATATATATGRRITVAALPPASLRSLGAWSLLVVRHTASASEPLPTIDLAGKVAPLTVDDPAPADSYTLALIDPIGRVGEPTDVAVS